MLGWTHSLKTAASVALVLSVSSIILLIGVAAFLVQIMRQQGRLLLRLEAMEQGAGIKKASAPDAAAVPQFGLPLGTPAPAFELNALDGGPNSLGGLLQEQKSLLLLFSHPDCGPCQALLPDIPIWQRDLSEHVAIAVVSEGSAAANRAKFEPLGIRGALIQERREVSESYQAWGTPAAVLIAPDGTIASYVAQGGDAIRALVGSLKQQRSLDKPAIAVGEPAPDLSFKSLSGKHISLAGFHGRETLLLFWNPQCGFCQKMLPDLKAWEEAALPGAPRLLVISTGNSSENRAMGLRSTVVFDTASKAAQAFQANGTPMAVLLDRRGRVASRVAAGAQAFFALAKSREGFAAPLNLAIEEG
jgi:thiol-disulfide isomerase/thioredoxin